MGLRNIYWVQIVLGNKNPGAAKLGIKSGRLRKWLETIGIRLGMDVGLGVSTYVRFGQKSRDIGIFVKGH